MYRYARASPAVLPFRSRYLTGTKKFRSISLVGWKWKSQPGWVIKPVQHNLVWRINSWSIGSKTRFSIFVLNDEQIPEIWQSGKEHTLLIGSGGYLWSGMYGWDKMIERGKRVRGREKEVEREREREGEIKRKEESIIIMIAIIITMYLCTYLLCLFLRGW